MRPTSTRIMVLCAAASVCSLGASFAGPVVAPAGQMPLPLVYNFNGIVHPGERLQPDAPNGFRSIADRALSLRDCDGASGDLLPTAVSGNTGLAYALHYHAGELDMVHLGDRNLVSGGTWAFDVTPDGDSVGIVPSWLPDSDQTTITLPIDDLELAEDFVLGLLYNASDGGGTFDLTLELADGSESTVTIHASDWFGPAGGVPDAPGPGVDLQANLGTMWCAADTADRAQSGPPLLVHEAVVSAASLVAAGELGAERTLTGLRVANRSNPNAGFGIYAMTVTVAGLIFADGFETGSAGMWSAAAP